MSLDYKLQDNVAVVTMDDGKANALSYEMIDALMDALRRAEREASAIVLAGRPERFCAGFDLRVMMSGMENAVAMVTRGGHLLLALYDAQVPLVIACTGHALAGGALVVLTGDWRVGAAGNFKLGLNEVAIGLAVPALAMELARDRLDKREMPRATMMAHIYAPDHALEAGWLDEVVAADRVVPRAIEEAARLGKLPQPAFRETKHRLRHQTIEYVRAVSAEDLRSLTIPTS
jgi:enoyl-CoA hydratase